VFENKKAWYADGLHFECQKCGRCCSGPVEGYIWVCKEEIDIIADFLDITAGQVRQNYLHRVGLRTTIVEQRPTRDCVFLEGVGEAKSCRIYSVRPNQCRTWPFWSSNLAGPDAWNKAAQRCGGINRGKEYTFDEIEKIKKRKQWWLDKEG